MRKVLLIGLIIANFVMLPNAFAAGNVCKQYYGQCWASNDNNWDCGVKNAQCNYQTSQ